MSELRKLRLILMTYVCICLIIMAILVMSLRASLTEEHHEGPETEMVAPGDWMEIPLDTQFEWYTVRFELTMECDEELDVAIFHGVHSYKSDPSMTLMYSKAMNDPDYGQRVLSTGLWRDTVRLECDCSCMLVIDNTPAGRVNQTSGPVRVSYELHWTEHRTVGADPQLVLTLVLAVSLPMVTIILVRRMDAIRAQEGLAEAQGAGTSSTGREP